MAVNAGTLQPKTIRFVSVDDVPGIRLLGVGATMKCEPACRDLLSTPRVAWLWPAAFLTSLAGCLLVPGLGGDLLAAAGFAVAGGLCVANAARCRRVHCTVTGPLYLVAALLFVARAGGTAIPSGWIVAGAAAGTALAFTPELLGKQYFEAPPPPRRS